MSTPAIEARHFAGRLGEWLRPEGPDADVILSCRVRLARNLEGPPFVTRLDGEASVAVMESLREHLMEARLDGETLWVQMDQAPPLLRLLLRERHLISRDLAPADSPGPVPPGRAVAFGASETIAAMINEEDHVRIQAIAAGFDLDTAWRKARELDRYLEQRVNFAADREFGYLTSCPTNVGTGMRASVMMHLPALGMVRSELEKVFTAAQRTGLAVRGMYGEGSRAAGQFYQISNQVTLGRTEGQLIDDLRALVPVIVRFERTVRQALLEEQRAALCDRIQRSHGLLRTSRSLATESALGHLSNVRLGLYLGLFEAAPIDVLNALGIQIQRGHVQALAPTPELDRLLEPSQRDRLRAVFLRRRLAAS